MDFKSNLNNYCFSKLFNKKCSEKHNERPGKRI